MNAVASSIVLVKIFSNILLPKKLFYSIISIADLIAHSSILSTWTGRCLPQGYSSIRLQTDQDIKKEVKWMIELKKRSDSIGIKGGSMQDVHLKWSSSEIKTIILYKYRARKASLKTIPCNFSQP